MTRASMIRSFLALAAVALLSVIVATPTHALIPSAAPSAPALRKDRPNVKIKNTSARVVHLNLGTRGGVVSINPLHEVHLDGDQAAAAREALGGPSKALVDDGSLVIDGEAKAPPPNPGPTAGGTTNMGDKSLAPNPSDLRGGDTDPGGYTPPQSPSSPSSPSSAPDAASSGSSRRSK